MPELSDRARAQLKAQRRLYVNSLPDKQTAIDRAWRRVLRSGWARDDLDALRTRIHRLAGSAGSYGLAELGDIAMNLDSLLVSEVDDSVTRTRVDQLMQSLKQAFAASAAEGG